MNIYIPDKHLQVPDNFKFKQSGRCVRIYKDEELYATFNSVTGSQAAIIRRAKQKLLLTMVIALLKDHNILKDDYSIYLNGNAYTGNARQNN
ncbi:MAG: hypothetical protein IKX14_00820 [Neisseriaceae bacterium]|nr:hypothetical protein [Neisseriaceae bacterium]